MQYLRAVYLYLGLVLFFTSLINAQAQYKYSYIPKTVYENQLFPVTVIALAENANADPKFTFDPSSNIVPIYDEPLIVRNGEDSFYTFYFQADTNDIKVPSLMIESQVSHMVLDSQNIRIKKLKKRPDFSHVLAADMKIKNHQVSNYDESSHIVTLTIEAYEANIEDMSLNDVQESDIENIKRNFAKVEAEFYVILPVETKQLKFTYFNTIKKQYVYLEVPTVVQDASVATHSDLNPKEDNFTKLKKYTLITLSVFFLLMFIFKRDFFYLVFAVISFITLLTLFIPHKKICISQGTPLYILPTETSTISAKIDEELETPLLGEREGYKKIEYKEGIIGWIKNENICKH